MRIKHLLVMVLLGLLIIGGCKTTKSTSKSELDKALLWEITGTGIKKPSYLYGTIHMIPATDYFLPKGTLNAIEQSDEMFFEIDMKDMNDVSALFGMMNKIFMKDGITLKTLLNEADYQLVSNQFSKLGLPMFMLERVKPMFLSAFAMGDLNPTSLQDGTIKSYEMEFYEISKDRKIPTQGLETIDFQISVFDSIPYADQAKMLVESLKASNTNDGEFQEMVRLYKSQDIEAMVATMGEEGSELGGYEDLLLTGRNKNWVPLIVDQVKKKPTFFAVGAGHLGGPNGVIQLLKAKGLKLRALKS
ncbi:MAG: TraB/GumN family protein [Saprospiraceae bacterium]|nr:TraB/GumN family protein [Saprospiraceae bacterium]